MHCVVLKMDEFCIASCHPCSYIVWNASHCHTVTNSVTVTQKKCHTVTLLLCHNLTISLAPGSAHHHMLHVTPSQGECATSWQPSSGGISPPQGGCCLPSLPRPGTGLVWRLEPEQELRDLGSGEAARARHGRGLVTRRPAATRT